MFLLKLFVFQIYMKFIFLKKIRSLQEKRTTEHHYFNQLDLFNQTKIIGDAIHSELQNREVNFEFISIFRNVSCQPM